MTPNGQVNGPDQEASRGPRRDYIERVADTVLADTLSRIGAVLVEGVKGSGKTETARRLAASEVRLDVDDSARASAVEHPASILAGPSPRLIDEWQLAPEVWNAVRRAVDDRQSDGQFILTGSANPSDDEARHSGAGRFARLRLRPLSLFESGLSSGQVSLSQLLEGVEKVEGQAPLTLEQLVEETCHGGWPADRSRPWQAAQRNAAAYLRELASADIRTVDGVRRDPTRLLGLLRAVALNTASEATLVTLAKDTFGAGPSPGVETVASYLDALSRLMVYEAQPPWTPVLRSKARVRGQAKHHLVDPALAAALLGASPEQLMLDLKTFSFLFESLCLRDLRVYQTDPLVQVGHYRDNTNLEVDAVVDAGYRRWAGFEVKLGGSPGAVDKAADSLTRFAAKVDVQSMGEPRALVVLTASGYAYTRRDGVHVVPLTTLGP
ncbi:MAG: DUF4143 domain-containing protein [Bifidobacteriaceae bacterium]|jgi:predicted AAA+ superfamily ATPase|nr:DUF4143 domain-containing protein [Bifidobacteriaceae bacterium]